MVRVSGLKQQMLLGITKTQEDGLTPREQLVAIHRVVTQIFSEANHLWREQLYPQLDRRRHPMLGLRNIGTNVRSEN